MSLASPSPAATIPESLPVVDSFAVAAQVRMTVAGTRARVSVALPEDVKATADTLISALLTLGNQVLEENRLTGQELPEVEVTEVERVETVPAGATATGFTVGVTNDLDAQRSALLLDSDYLLGNDGGLLLVAATLFAGAEHLLEVREHGAPQAAKSRGRRTGSGNRRRGGRRR